MCYLKACLEVSKANYLVYLKQTISFSVILLVCGVILASQYDLKPKIPPGYKPVDAQTEKGIWMELQEYEKEIQRSALLVKDKHVNDYVKNVACRVAGDYCNDLRIYVIRNPNFNASMTANGIMQIWTGLLIRVSSEDELAAIIGHELAHYTQLHTLERARSIIDSASAGSVLDFGLILLTGVSIPVGQLAAVLNVLAFSREQEQEADLLGVKFIAGSSYDPSAAVRVWKAIIEEEEVAVVKRNEPGIFSKTHPGADERIVVLDSYVKEHYKGLLADPKGKQRHVEMLNHYYMTLMEDQLDTNRYGRTESMLRHHRSIGVDSNLINYFWGEMYRQRNEEGDLNKAKESYKNAIQGETPVADAYLNLGYIYLKQGSLPEAKHYFSQYLEMKPEADDRAMIEFYLQE
jgi:beta-barrel assembly-enhancing protease